MSQAGRQSPPPSGSACSTALEREVAHFRALVELTSDWVWEVDEQARYTYASPKVKDLLGYEPQEVLGRTPFELMATEEGRRVQASFFSYASQRREFHELLNVNQHKSGREVVLESSGVPIFDDAGAFRGYRGIDRDVTLRMFDEQRLHLMDAAVRAAAEGIMVADSKGRITACNPAFATMTGYLLEELVGRAPHALVAADGTGREALWTLIGHEPKWSGEGTCLHRTGESFPVWMTLSAVNDDSGITGYVAVVVDMTERRAAEAAMRFQATHDPLTQVSNRTGFLASLAQAIAQGRAQEARLAVLFIDLDGFKSVNDRHGHGAGDVLLSTAARRLERCIRRGDLLARFGGDEFTLLLPDIEGRAVAQRVAKDCVNSLHVPFRINGLDVWISASVGLAVFPEDGNTVDELLSAADGAMYRAKHAGGDRLMHAAPRRPPAPETPKQSETPKQRKTPKARKTAPKKTSKMRQAPKKQ